MTDEAMSAFDPDAFANVTIEEANSTEYVPIPEGDYIATVDKYEPKVTPNGKPVLEVFWKLDAPENEDVHEKVIRQGIWLDVNGQGSLEMGKGKNVQLGRLREAVGQNTPGQAWSPAMLEGAVAKVSVKQTMAKDGSGAVYSNISGVAKAA